MAVYSMLLITFLVASLSVFIVFNCRSLQLSTCWPGLVLAISIAVFIYLYGTWVFVSVYFKYIFGTFFVVTIFIFLFKARVRENRVATMASTVWRLLVAIIPLSLSLLYFTGTANPSGSINLALPFKTGKYFVFQGGKGLPTNVFHFAGRRTLFAMDIIKLNDFGGRGRKIFSENLNDYSIFGDTIYSPCDGVVLTSEASNPDNIPPNMKRGPKNLNCVLIETSDAYVFLGHMKQGAVFVSEGMHVSVGQPLGLAGNSGNSLEPHLHIQAHAKTLAGVPWYRQQQLLIKFHGKSYRLFETIDAKE